ncbi:hypothetical protein GUJ93_ZPchr0006g40772 [Zizania palustris]|uniref:Uncharacterized protein n=1 Tax=Zizania palustris TaxID=103762 RepID=A0A8J5S704_ZIZPA|nr:hypothetical protein GUJ93_ZPchr0006g40772 [Zizania palustris]
MDAASAELLEALAIMFTVIPFGLVVVIVQIIRTQRSISDALMSGILTAFWAWGLIKVKRLNFWLQRAGRFDQMFSLMQIHLFEMASYLMLLLILSEDGLQGMLRMVIKCFRGLARPLVRLYLVGLAITGYGMGVLFAGPPDTTTLFHGDFGVHFITTGLIVIIFGVSSHPDDLPGRMAAVSLIAYICLLFVATYIGGSWQ